MPESKVKKDMWHAPGASQGDIMEFQIACLLFEKHKTILLYHMSDRQDYDMNRINCGDIMVWRCLRTCNNALRKMIPCQNIEIILKNRFRLRKRYFRSIALMSGCLDLQIRAIQTSRDSSLPCTLLADAIVLAQHVLTNAFVVRFQSEINRKYGSLRHLDVCSFLFNFSSEDR